MSRLGKKPIVVPEKVEVSLTDRVFVVKGPQGELSREIHPDITVTIEGNEIQVNPTKETKLVQALWGTYASHIQNMIQGVTTPYEKKLVIEGVGYRAEMKGKTLSMLLGYSHPVDMEVPEGLTVAVEKNEITITGIDKEQVGQFAAEVRKQRKPEPYKGKGIRYSDEVIRRKQGKKAV